MQKKLVVLFILVLLAFAGLSVRLIMINKDNGEQYKKQVLSSVSIRARRFRINGGRFWTARERSLPRTKRYTIWFSMLSR